MPYYSRGWRSSEVEDLQELFLEVQLLRCAVIRRQAFDMFREGGDKRQEEKVLLFRGERLELLDVELWMRWISSWYWSFVGAICGARARC